MLLGHIEATSIITAITSVLGAVISRPKTLHNNMHKLNRKFKKKRKEKAEIILPVRNGHHRGSSRSSRSKWEKNRERKSIG